MSFPIHSGVLIGLRLWNPPAIAPHRDIGREGEKKRRRAKYSLSLFLSLSLFFFFFFFGGAGEKNKGLVVAK
jgi:hypothetical protein